MTRLMIIALGIMLFVPSTSEDGESLSATQITLYTMSAAGALYNDMATFCTRNADACESGAELAGVFQSKLRTGANLVAEYLENPDTAVETDAIQTGSIN